MALLLDLRHLSRSLRRSPISAVAAVVTLSLTLGAGASIFAIVDAVLLTPPPFADPEALVTIEETPIRDPIGTRRVAVPFATFTEWRNAAGGRARLEAFDGTNLTLTGLGAAERVSVLDVTPGLLPLLGVTPASGRRFEPADQGQPVVILTHTFWLTKLAGRSDVIGQTLVLGNQPHTIIGVLPERFIFAIDDADLWRALPVTSAAATATGYRVRVIARVAEDASAAMVSARLDAVSRRSAPPARAIATPIRTQIAGFSAGTLGVLAAASATAALIAFINLSGLLLVRSIDRRNELAVRTAVGAGATETAKQLALEAFALVGCGFAGGVLLADWLTPVIARLTLEFSGLANQQVTVSWWSLGVIGGAAATCAVACALLPAITATRWHLPDVFRRTTTPSRHELLVRRLLVAGEVSLAFVLLVAMALLGQTLFTVLRVNPGFEVGKLLIAQVALPAAGYPTPQQTATFYDTLQNSLQERLGANSVAVVDEMPLTHDRGRGMVGVPDGSPARETVVRTAGPQYFAVMRIPVLAGRPLDATDNATAPPRVVISQSLARLLFGDQPAIGRPVQLAGAPQTAEVVGVVGDVKLRSLSDPSTPTLYLSGLQVPSRGSILVLRSSRPDADVIAAVREEVGRLDRNLPVYGARPMAEVVARSPGVPAARLLTAAFAGFALLAVVLSVVGLFGIAAHDVARRRHEIGLRLALGASPQRLLLTTVTQSARLIAIGIAAGGLLSVAAVQALARATHVGAGLDVLSVVVAATVLAAAGIGAVLPAALRAARTDPLTALRVE